MNTIARRCSTDSAGSLRTRPRSRAIEVFGFGRAYSVLQSWPRIAAEYLRAQGDGGAEAVFSTDTLGLAYRPKGEGTPPQEFAARASRSDYGRGEVPPGALVLTLGIDVQLDRCEWQLLGHGEGYRRFVIDIGTIGKHVSEPDAQRNLDLALATPMAKLSRPPGRNIYDRNRRGLFDR